MITRNPGSSAAAIAIGVTGHRPPRLQGVDFAALYAGVGEVFRALEVAAPGASFRLVGSLAEGADTIAADVALELHWQADAVLPFARCDYAADFHGRGAIELERHLAAADSVFELPGSRNEQGEAAAAYERAGRIVLAQSDLLVAVWDGAPPAGRGGAAQMVAEAVAQGIPVIAIDPRSYSPPTLLWRGLNQHGFGPEGVDTVARGAMSALPRLLQVIADETHRGFGPPRGWARLVSRPLKLSYPLLLAATGVRGFGQAGAVRLPSALPASPTGCCGVIDERLLAFVHPEFIRADSQATEAAQLFRGAFVSNFLLAALAVSLSLAGLAAPAAVRPVLALLEFGSILMILLITRAGGQCGWHEKWLHCRRVAERLRCLQVSALLGDLMLRDGSAGEERVLARSLGLPSGVADLEYVAKVHRRLVDLLDDQIAYLQRERERMHLLEHRLHRIGGVLFVTVAVVCAGVFSLEAVATILPQWAEGLHHIPLGVSLLSAALPAIGAAIYGIRMQGDFAGTAERNASLAAQLDSLRAIAADDRPDFDGVLRLARRTTHLLSRDVGEWFHSSRARPLTLPG